MAHHCKLGVRVQLTLFHRLSAHTQLFGEVALLHVLLAVSLLRSTQLLTVNTKYITNASETRLMDSWSILLPVHKSRLGLKNVFTAVWGKKSLGGNRFQVK